jgi:serine/threonine kinase 16
VVGAEIAQGGFSFVYKARDTHAGEAFALKKILCQTEEQVQLAKAEIQAHRAFAHPNIMPLSDYAVVSTGPETFEYYLLFPFMEVRMPAWNSVCVGRLTLFVDGHRMEHCVA